MTQVKKEEHKRLFTEVGDAIMGARIFVRCQKPGNWILYQKSAAHRGSYCILRKDAYARIERAFSSIEK